MMRQRLSHFAFTLTSGRLGREQGVEALFGPDLPLFTSVVDACSVYGEYGVGQSTAFVALRTTIPILAVDSSEMWIESVRQKLPRRSRVEAEWVDLGPLGDWGMPISYDMRANIPLYVQSLWHRSVKPDAVLVDGRFRVSCVMASLLNARPGTKIVLDDFVERPEYRVVEEVIRPLVVGQRQAVFEVPGEFDRPRAEELLASFLHVRD